eukprot:IDg8649t1
MTGKSERLRRRPGSASVAWQSGFGCAPPTGLTRYPGREWAEKNTTKEERKEGTCVRT